MPNVMVALPNIGSALCSTPQSLADAQECRAEPLPRRESRWNWKGCPKLANRSQPLVARSSPYYEDVEEVLLSNKFFPIVDACLSSEDIARHSCVMVPIDGEFLAILGPVFPASRVLHISDLHSKFALGPHHVWKYGRYPICGRWD